MTMTEPPPTAEATPPPEPELATPADQSTGTPAAVAGLYNWLCSNHHATVGRTWLASSLLTAVAAAAVGVFLGVERIDPAAIDVFGGVNSYFQMWTLYRFAMVLFVAAPLFVGLAAVVVPMQVGAANMAFPRAFAGAVWLHMLGAGIVIVSVLAGGGWGALDGVSVAEADAIGLTLVGTAMVIGSLLVAAACIATTVISLRVRGMSLDRVPLFSWSMLVAASVWLLTLPVALANIALIYVDLRAGSLSFGFPQGPDPVIYAQLEWLFLQPQVYAVAIPVLGVLGSVVPVVAGARQASHSAMLVLIGGFGLLAVGGWSQPYFADTTDDFVFVAFGLAILLPVLGSLGGAAATLRAGGVPAALPPAHLLGAMGGGLLLLAAAASGALRVVEPFGLNGTAVHTGTLNLVVFAAVTAAVGGIWFWGPQIACNVLPARRGLMVAASLILGTLLLGSADVAAGLLGAADVMTDSSGGAVDAMLVVSVIGTAILVLALLGVLAGIASAARASSACPLDPWGGHSLEWRAGCAAASDSTSDPLAALLPVTSEAPLLDLASAADGSSIAQDPQSEGAGRAAGPEAAGSAR